MKQKLGMKANRAELFSRFGILLIFALVVLVASLVSNRFLSTDNILSVFTQCTVIGVLSCGMTMLIVSGNTDLSAGSGVALAGVVCALVINTSGSWVLAVLATVRHHFGSREERHRPSRAGDDQSLCLDQGKRF